MSCFAGPCSEGPGGASAALAALKAAVQALGPAAPLNAKPSARPAGRGRRGAGGTRGRPSGMAVVVLDEMDQLLAGDTAVLTELFLLPKVRADVLGIVKEREPQSAVIEAVSLLFAAGCDAAQKDVHQTDEQPLAAAVAMLAKLCVLVPGARVAQAGVVYVTE